MYKKSTSSSTLQTWLTVLVYSILLYPSSFFWCTVLFFYIQQNSNIGCIPSKNPFTMNKFPFENVWFIHLLQKKNFGTAYDRAAVKFRGIRADINFNLSDYEDDVKQMKNLSKEEFIHILCRQSIGFSRGNLFIVKG
ncbi:hypothetical protein Lal_00018582 [Lupinus albus]|nr:hypothetical protein Lal_00018582 [Lupinus albus]